MNCKPPDFPSYKASRRKFGGMRWIEMWLTPIAFHPSPWICSVNDFLGLWQFSTGLTFWFSKLSNSIFIGTGRPLERIPVNPRKTGRCLELPWLWSTLVSSILLTLFSPNHSISIGDWASCHWTIRLTLSNLSDLPSSSSNQGKDFQFQSSIQILFQWPSVFGGYPEPL